MDKGNTYVFNSYAELKDFAEILNNCGFFTRGWAYHGDWKQVKPGENWNKYGFQEIPETTKGYETNVLGIVCGNGVEVIDIDTKNDSTGTLWEDYKTAILEQPGGAELLKKLHIHVTKSGGYHLLYQCKTYLKTKVLATDNGRTIIEVLSQNSDGKGGAFCYIAPPRSKVELQKSITQDKLYTITTAEREILIQAARDQDKKNKTTEAKPEPASSSNTHTRANDIEVLYACIKAAEKKNLMVDDYGIRLKIGFAIATTLSEAGRELFHRISSNSSKYNKDEADRKYTNLVKTGRGSVTVATIAYLLEKEGIEFKDYLPQRAPGATPTPPTHSQSKPQQEPEPKGATKKKLPYHLLPKRMYSFVKAGKVAKGAPEEFTAMGMLWAFATAAGMHVKMEHEDQTPILWMTFVARSGANKTGALNLITKPLKQYDFDRSKQYEEAAAEIRAQGKRPGAFSQLIYRDATPEALMEGHAARPRGICLVKSEIANWLKSFNRYTQGGEIERFLELWDGDLVTVNRRTSDSIRLNETFVNVIGSIQPAVLDVFATEGKSRNGFTSRMLYVWPENLKKPPRTGIYFDAIEMEKYTEAIGKVFSINKQVIVKVAPDANKWFLDWCNTFISPLIDNGTDIEAEMYSKYEYHLQRIALALHIARYAYDNEDLAVLTKRTYQDAAEIIYYLIDASDRVHKHLFGGSRLDKMEDQKRALYDSLPDDFSKQEAKEKGAGLKINSRTLDNTLAKWTDEKFIVKIAHGKYRKAY